jgi:hypothetical protein
MARSEHQTWHVLAGLLAILAGSFSLAACAWAPPGALPQYGPASSVSPLSSQAPNATVWAQATLTPFTPEPAHNPGVADLLRNPPPAGQSVEVDAYFDGAGVPAMPGGPPPLPDQVVCPQEWNSTLTDRPYPVALLYLNTTQGSPLPDDAPWLIAAIPEQTRPGAREWPQLPYHARLRGHLGDPAFVNAQCRHAERIFVVERVVKVYQQDLPDPSIYQLKAAADYASWLRYADAALGYSLPYPPGWGAQRLDSVTVALRGPQWPGNPVLVRVHDGEIRYDQYDPAVLPPLLQGAQSWGQFRQGGWPYDQAAPASQGLDGYQVQRYPAGAGASDNSISVLFAANGRTYELALTYLVGFGASSALLADYTAIVQGFRLDKLPGPSPTPPVNQELGQGPFLSEEQALARARERSGGPLDDIGGRLVPEAVARSSVGPCSTFTGHPEGVWLLMVYGEFEGQKRHMRLLLDARTGEQLCGEEVQPDTPMPPNPPGTTPTPVPTETPAPTLMPGIEPPTPPPPGAVLPAQAFIDLYSGRADNPSWWLSAGEVEQLDSLLGRLAPALCAPLPGNLGYRGFVLPLDAVTEHNLRKITVFRGVIWYGDPAFDASAVCSTDPGRQVERFLLALGQPHLASDIYAVVAQDLAPVVPGPPTWAPAPASSASPTAYSTPTPAPFPGDWRLTLSAVPEEGSAPLIVKLQATLAGGPDNSYELYCASAQWDFGDGERMDYLPDCVIWTPESRVQRSFTTEHTYARPGNYQVGLSVDPGLTSNPVTVEVR